MKNPELNLDIEVNVESVVVDKLIDIKYLEDGQEKHLYMTHRGLIAGCKYVIDSSEFVGKKESDGQ